LSNFQFREDLGLGDGITYIFPGGTILEPGKYLVVAKNRQVFASTYGRKTIPVGDFGGQLSNGGEVVNLRKPDLSIVDTVNYDNVAPWPTAADGTGPALQLKNPALDNNVGGNWSVNSSTSPRWQLKTATGTASSSTLYVYLKAPGEVYIDDMKLVAGSVPEVGANYIQNGDFESALSGPWTVSPNHAGTVISTALKRTGTGSLRLNTFSGGTTQSSSVWQNTVALTSGATYTLSLWYLPSTSDCQLEVRLSGSGVDQHQDVQSELITKEQYTPGELNSVQ
jgi:hypothetical protein